jgi:hypothetical protein
VQYSIVTCGFTRASFICLTLFGRAYPVEAAPVSSQKRWNLNETDIDLPQ